MKIGIRSYGRDRDNLDGFGGLELRYTVQNAHFLRSEGHEVHFFDERSSVGEDFDLVLDAPRHDCSNIRAKAHLHNWYSPFPDPPLISKEMQDNPCYQRGDFLLSQPYKYGYDLTVRNMDKYKFKDVLFTPLPYPDDLLPENIVPGFDRNIIFWGNKGNFNPEFGPERGMHYITNGINTLKALVRLKQRVDFQAVFVLDNLIRNTRLEWRDEVESLIGQLKDVVRLEQIPWSQYLAIMSRTKINTHVGGLTSGINECIFTYGVPAVPRKFIFFQDVAKEVDLMPPAEVSTANEIYDAYEKLWFDEHHYNKVRDAFQDAFMDHRTGGLGKQWKTLEEVIYG